MIGELEVSHRPGGFTHVWAATLGLASISWHPYHEMDTKHTTATVY